MAWSHHTRTLYNQTWQKHLRVGRAENKHSQYEKNLINIHCYYIILWHKWRGIVRCRWIVQCQWIVMVDRCKARRCKASCYKIASPYPSSGHGKAASPSLPAHSCCITIITQSPIFGRAMTWPPPWLVLADLTIMKPGLYTRVTFMLRSQLIRNSSIETAVCDMWNFLTKWSKKPPIMWNHMCIGVVIGRTCMWKWMQAVRFQGDFNGKRQTVVFVSKRLLLTEFSTNLCSWKCVMEVVFR